MLSTETPFRGVTCGENSVQPVNNPGWSIRLATVEDTLTLADIVIEAIKETGAMDADKPDRRRRLAQGVRRLGR